MQKILITCTLLLVAIGTATAQDKKGTAVMIQDARKEKRHPQANIPKHKYHDVDVYRIILGKDDGYKIIYYPMEHDSLKDYAFMVGDDNAAFDKATYSWDKDTVSVYFINSKTKKEKRYRGYGHNGSSSMMVDE